MPLTLLADHDPFPDANQANPSGMLAIGGDLSAKRLLQAYRCGIFPWYSKGQPILWWSPDPRCLLIPKNFHWSHSLAKMRRQGRFRLAVNTAFGQVIRACSGTPRPGQGGTWITPAMVAAYEALHDLGYAASVEVYAGERLVGGLYGVVMKPFFFGESMFSHARDASKLALGFLCEDRELQVIDCQMPTAHLLSLGAEIVPRRSFLALLASHLGPAPPFP